MKNLIDEGFEYYEDARNALGLHDKPNFASELLAPVLAPAIAGFNVLGDYWDFPRPLNHNGLPDYHQRVYKPPALTSRGGYKALKTSLNLMKSRILKSRTTKRKHKGGLLSRPNGQQIEALKRFKAGARRGKLRLKARPGGVRQSQPRYTGSSRALRPGQSRGVNQPAARQYTTGLGTRMNIRSKNYGDVVNVPFQLWDDVISSVYPGSSSATNTIVIGSTYAACSAEYVLLPRSQWYTPNPVRVAADPYSMFAIDSWSLEFIPCVNYQNNGEVFWISGTDPAKLLNKGLTFDCTDAKRGVVNGVNVPLSDYQGVFPAGTLGNAADHTAAIKQWSEVHPRQFAPFDKYTVSLSHERGWKRNDLPDRTGAVDPLNWATCSPPEFKLNTAGYVAVYGTMLDSYPTTGANVMRKIGDLFLRVRLRLKGLGPADIYADIPSYTGKLLRDERFIAEFKTKLGISDEKIQGLNYSPDPVKLTRRDFVDPPSPTPSEKSLLGKHFVKERKSASLK